MTTACEIFECTRATLSSPISPFFVKPDAPSVARSCQDLSLFSSLSKVAFGRFSEEERACRPVSGTVSETALSVVISVSFENMLVLSVNLRVERHGSIFIFAPSVLKVHYS